MISLVEEDFFALKRGPQHSTPIKGKPEGEGVGSNGHPDAHHHHHHQSYQGHHQDPHGQSGSFINLSGVSTIDGSFTTARNGQQIQQLENSCVPAGLPSPEALERSHSYRYTEQNGRTVVEDQEDFHDSNEPHPGTGVRSHSHLGSGDNKTLTSIDPRSQHSRHSDLSSKSSVCDSETDSEHHQRRASFKSILKARGSEPYMTQERSHYKGRESPHVYGPDLNFCNHSNDKEDKSVNHASKRNTALYIEQDVITKQRREIHLLMDELATRDKELNDLVRSHQSQVKAWENDRERLDQLQARLTKYEDELKRSDNQLKETLAEMTRVCEQKELDASALMKSRTEMEALMEKIKQNSVYIREIELENDHLDDRVKELIANKQDMEDRERELIDMIKQKDDLIAKKQSQAEQVREEIQGLKQVVEGLEEKDTNLNAELEAWKEKYCVARDQADRLTEEVKVKNAAVAKSTQQLHESLQQAIALQKALFTSCEREKCKEELLYSLRKQQKRTMQELSNLRELYDRQNQDMTLYHLSVQDKDGQGDSKHRSPKKHSSKNKSPKKDRKDKNMSFHQKDLDQREHNQNSFLIKEQIPSKAEKFQDNMVEEGTSTTELTAGVESSDNEKSKGHKANTGSGLNVDVKPTISSSWKNSRLVSPSRVCSSKNQSRNASQELSSSLQAVGNATSLDKCVRSQSASPICGTQVKEIQPVHPKPPIKPPKTSVEERPVQGSNKGPNETSGVFDSSSDVSQLWSPLTRMDQDLPPADSDGMCQELSRALPPQDDGTQLMATPVQSPVFQAPAKLPPSIHPSFFKSRHRSKDETSENSKSLLKDSNEERSNTPRGSTKHNQDAPLSSGADDEATPKASPQPDMWKKLDRAQSQSPGARRRSASPNKRSRKERSMSPSKRRKQSSGKISPVKTKDLSLCRSREASAQTKSELMNKTVESCAHEALTKSLSRSGTEKDISCGKGDCKVGAQQKEFKTQRNQSHHTPNEKSKGKNSMTVGCSESVRKQVLRTGQGSPCQIAVDCAKSTTKAMKEQSSFYSLNKEEKVSGKGSGSEPKTNILYDSPNDFKSAVTNLTHCCNSGSETGLELKQCKHKATCTCCVHTESLSRIESLYSAKSRFSPLVKCLNNNQATDTSFTNVSDEGCSLQGPTPQSSANEGNVCSAEDPYRTLEGSVQSSDEKHLEIETASTQNKREQCFSKDPFMINWDYRKSRSQDFNSSDAHLSSSDEGRGRMKLVKNCEKSSYANPLSENRTDFVNSSVNGSDTDTSDLNYSKVKSSSGGLKFGPSNSAGCSTDTQSSDSSWGSQRTTRSYYYSEETSDVERDSTTGIRGQREKFIREKNTGHGPTENYAVAQTGERQPFMSIRAPSLYKELSKIHYCEKTRRYEWSTPPPAGQVDSQTSISSCCNNNNNSSIADNNNSGGDNDSGNTNSNHHGNTVGGKGDDLMESNSKNKDTQISNDFDTSENSSNNNNNNNNSNSIIFQNMLSICDHIISNSEDTVLPSETISQLCANSPKRVTDLKSETDSGHYSESNDLSLQAQHIDDQANQYTVVDDVDISITFGPPGAPVRSSVAQSGGSVRQDDSVVKRLDFSATLEDSTDSSIHFSALSIPSNAKTRSAPYSVHDMSFDCLQGISERDRVSTLQGFEGLVKKTDNIRDGVGKKYEENKIYLKEYQKEDSSPLAKNAGAVKRLDLCQSSHHSEQLMGRSSESYVKDRHDEGDCLLEEDDVHVSVSHGTSYVSNSREIPPLHRHPTQGDHVIPGQSRSHWVQGTEGLIDCLRNDKFYHRDMNIQGEIGFDVNGGLTNDQSPSNFEDLFNDISSVSSACEEARVSENVDENMVILEEVLNQSEIVNRNTVHLLQTSGNVDNLTEFVDPKNSHLSPRRVDNSVSDGGDSLNRSMQVLPGNQLDSRAAVYQCGSDGDGTPRVGPIEKQRLRQELSIEQLSGEFDEMLHSFLEDPQHTKEDSNLFSVPPSPATKLHRLLMESQEMIRRLEKTSAIPEDIRVKASTRPSH